MKLKSRFLIPEPLTERDIETMQYWLSVYEYEVKRVQNICAYFKANNLVGVA